MEREDASFFGLHVPFLQFLGVRPEGREPGRAAVSLELRPELTNSWEVAHGAVVTALLDCSMAAAARSLGEGGVLTLDLSVTFVRAGTGRLAAEGRVLRSSGSLAFCEGEVRDAGGELVAKGLATYKRRRRERAPQSAESTTRKTA